MAQWGRNDHAVTANASTTVESSNGAPIGTYALVKGDQVNRVDGANAHFGNTSSGSRAGVDFNMFGNTTIGAFMPGVAKGVFAVNAYSMGTTGGNLVIGIVTSGGTGYNANAAVTLTVTNGGTGGVLNAHANVTTNAGRIDALNVQTPGSAYITAPTVAIAAPASQSLTPNTTGIVLSATAGGANITLTEARIGAAETGHSIQGQTATGYVDTNSVYPQVTHSGWVLRTEGSGGRAGRVQYETLVASGSICVNTVTSTGVVGNPDTVTSNTVDQYV